MIQALDRDLRSALEKTVKAARTVAETAAQAAVEQLGVGHDKPETFLSDDEKALRNRLRTHGKQLGDARDSKSTNPTYGKQEVQHLVQEVAYQHWHRMLFARFLADNNLLMYDGVAVTIEECDELAPDENATSGWELAGKLAARMLPQIFKSRSPVFELTFAPEHQHELERLLAALTPEVFQASDSLGWVYQFWQAQRKDDINKSEVKIGAAELPAVTQLFTEPYMVDFLLHNSLGAWWATRHPGQPCPVPLPYLRTLDDGTPAAGKFEGWPATLKDFKVLDPCCGSGHFLVAAFLLLVPMRMAAEGLTTMDAVDLVLQDNLHGLELDARCVEIAVFALALTAWRYPDEDGNPLGVRADMPAPQVACCGLQVAASAEDWVALIPDTLSNKELVAQDLRGLNADFMQSPLLGSLLDPSRSQKHDLAHSQYGNSFDVLHDLMEQALARETHTKTSTELNDASWNLALSAKGMLDAARLLMERYHLVITNVPYLGAGKQNDSLRSYIESHYPDAKVDLANVFLERCLELSLKNTGVVQVVMPESWLLQARSENQRKKLLHQSIWLSLGLLGGGGDAFERGPGNIVSIIVLSLLNKPLDIFKPPSIMSGVDVSMAPTPTKKAEKLILNNINTISQNTLLKNIGHRISLDLLTSDNLLSAVAHSVSGMKTGDVNRFNRDFWEIPYINSDWNLIQQSIGSTNKSGGREEIIFWQGGKGQIKSLAEFVKGTNHVAQNWRRGQDAWGKNGVALTAMGDIYVNRYSGEIFDSSVTVIFPILGQEDILPAIYTFCLSDQFKQDVRKLDKKLSITTAAFVKVPFDLAHWRKVATERYPDGLPKPYSDDPTQWLFHGHPQPATDPLQVAVARLVGYRWPAEQLAKPSGSETPALGEFQAKSPYNPLEICASSYQNNSIDPSVPALEKAEMELSDAALARIARSRTLASHADSDGIVCIPPVGREFSANDRLLNLLADAYGADWSSDTLAQLLTTADHASKSLETWLRDKFFAQHCKRFHHRPFVWHVWDGLHDGFAALVNYHKLDYKTLESLIYTYLGDWITRQKRDASNGVDGAQEKLAAAETLKKRLELILAGEAPYDIFVRWKPIEEQPVGWNPDLNDGVRLNIRPFLSVPDVGKRGAGVLRDKPNIQWEKDRGSDVTSAPWYELGLHYDGKIGDRINDHHLSLADKSKAGEKAK